LGQIFHFYGQGSYLKPKSHLAEEEGGLLQNDEKIDTIEQ